VAIDKITKMWGVRSILLFDDPVALTTRALCAAVNSSDVHTDWSADHMDREATPPSSLPSGNAAGHLREHSLGRHKYEPTRPAAPSPGRISHLFPPKQNSSASDTYFCYRQSKPQGIVRPERLIKLITIIHSSGSIYSTK
jgi:hypothetical protein